MDSKTFSTVVLIVMAAFFAVTAALLMMQSRAFARDMIRTNARVEAIAPIGSRGQREAVVEFVDEEGNLIRQKAQPIGSWGVGAGDEVEILYTKKEVFGQHLWNIFIVRNASFCPYRIHDIMGAIMLVVAVALLMAGIGILRK